MVPILIGFFLRIILSFSIILDKISEPIPYSVHPESIIKTFFVFFTDLKITSKFKGFKTLRLTNSQLYPALVRIFIALCDSVTL